MSTMLEVGGISLEVVTKDIKNVHLSVYPPEGRVRISAPSRMSTETIRLFAISRLGWIRREQKKLREQERETEREFLDRESHYVWGRRYLLKVVEAYGPTSASLEHGNLVVRVKPEADKHAREAVVAGWYREQLKSAMAPLIAAWEPRLGVTVNKFFVQQMKTRWGSCNPAAGTIRVNTELAKKPRACLEYIVVHEMVHLIEPTHSANFIALMERAMPAWRVSRNTLNRLPVRHEDWDL